MDLARLTNRIEVLFGQSARETIMPMHDRFLCTKYILQTEEGPLFVKQYRERRAGEIAHIRSVEQFFSNQGFPIILPQNDVNGQPAFYEQETWFSVFPFIESRVPEAHELTGPFLYRLGRLLGQIHQVGVHASQIWAPPISAWSAQQFELEYRAIKQLLAVHPTGDPLLAQVIAGLEKKRSMIRNGMPSVERFSLPFDCLLYGDFLYQNVFVDAQEEVVGLYDLDLCTRGPRAYEVARSLLIQAFDNGWNDEGMELGRQFFAGYQSVFPLNRAEFEQGIKMYMSHTVHLTYLEARFAQGQKVDETLYARHMRRAGQWGMDLPEFCDALFSGIDA